MPQHVVALIPARGGSKGILRKNLQCVGGVALVVRSIRHALAVPGIAQVYVSTDDAEIAAVARAAGALVIDRPAALAIDTASTESAIEHAMALWTNQGLAVDAICLLQCTSPFRSPGQLENALHHFWHSGCDSLLSAVRDHCFFWRDDGQGGGSQPVNYQPTARPRRQDHSGWLRETGSFYIFRAETFRQHRSRLGGHIETFEVPAQDALEIDDRYQLEWARLMWQSRGETPIPSDVSRLRWLVLDVDGTLTDGTMAYGEDGVETKVFHTRDGHGLARWKAAGGKVAWITSEAVDLVMRRAHKLGIDFVALGCKDKAHGLEVLMREHAVEANAIVAMGDDVLDLPWAQRCALFVAPADAQPEVAAQAAWLTQNSGGHGAVREVVEVLLGAGALAANASQSVSAPSKVA